MLIGSRRISRTSLCYLIAEAGVNHNGDVSLAHEMVDVAADAGFDAIKFQTFVAQDLVSKGAPKAEYQLKNTRDKSESQLQMLSKLALPESAFRALFDHATDRQIEFISSPFDLKSAELLARLGVRAIKVASGELTNLPFLRHLGEMRIPLIVSTGMSNIAEVSQAADVLSQAGVDYAFLHCTSLYPAPFESLNLRAMATMRAVLDCPIGYSDHSLGTTACVAAVALGAEIIEKHFTLDRSLPGPDHPASLSPDELAIAAESIREVEAAMGSRRKFCTPLEEATRDIARKSLVTTRTIRAGETITKQDIAVKRPGTGIPPLQSPFVEGRLVARDIQEDAVIQWSDLA
jgi:N-acetylneuraminate synthase